MSNLCHETIQENKYATMAKVCDTKLVLPHLPYRPQRPCNYKPRIGLLACGGITEVHLMAYRNAGYDVVAMMDPVIEKAKSRRDVFYPFADVYNNANKIWERQDIDVVDIAAHPLQREEMLEQAIRAGKHVLSQKPFVLDIDFGNKLVSMAEDARLKLAVNQNGRWAPNLSWMREAIRAQLIGYVNTIDCLIAWDHSWVKNTTFEGIPNLILFDFAIHWFDMLNSFMPDQKPVEVMAYASSMRNQSIRPPLMAQVMVQYEHTQATLIFRAGTIAGKTSRILVTGEHGTLLSEGVDVNSQQVTLSTCKGAASPLLQGAWFPDGMDGAMSELLLAIEEDREPCNSGRDNLKSLAICFSAMQSVEIGRPVKVGDIRQVKESWIKYS